MNDNLAFLNILDLNDNQNHNCEFEKSDDDSLESMKESCGIETSSLDIEVGGS